MFMLSLIALRKPAVLCEPALLPGARPEVPKELWRRHQGCRARVKRRAKKRRHRPAVPAIVMGSVRSLGKKTDERRHGFTHTSRTTVWRFPASALFGQTGT